MAGAALGAAGGPVGMAAGAAIGAAAGGIAGKGASEAVNPEAEDRHWSDSYRRSHYYSEGQTYEDYRPAYRLGYTGRSSSGGSFDQAEQRLSQDWNQVKASSRLTWEQAKLAARDAWDRATR